MNDLKMKIMHLLIEKDNITAIEIAGTLGIYTELANHHLSAMYKMHMIFREKLPYFNKYCTRDIYHYRVNHDWLANNELSESNHPVQFDEVTPFMAKMLGINMHKIPMNLGRIYTEQYFSEAQKEKGYKSWNPSKPKSVKNHVTGTTLSWL